MPYTSNDIFPTPTASTMPCEGTVRIMRKRFLDGLLSLEEANEIAGKDVRMGQGKVKAMYPTPTLCGLDGGSNSRKAAKKRGMYPTPTAQDSKNNGSQSQMDRNSLPLNCVAGMIPTPCTHGVSGGSGARDRIEQLYEEGHISEEERRSMQSGNGGKLNPDWVEWLMGWGIGWTDPKVENEDIFFLPMGLDPADYSAMNRLTSKKENRVSRLKALGNGQVPLCAAVAFEWGMDVLDSLEK